MTGVEPNWQPLEKPAEVVAPAGPHASMWTGTSTWSSNGARAQLYKHHDTRRYLNVDAGGHTYRFRRDGSYGPWRSPAPAIATAYERGLVYACWTNVDAGCMRPYEPGDRRG